MRSGKPHTDKCMHSMPLVIIALLIQLMVTTFALWLAMKLTKEDGPFLGLLAAAFIASLVELLPIMNKSWPT